MSILPSNQVEPVAEGSKLPTALGRRWNPVDLAAVAAVAGALIWAYWPNLARLARVWSTQPDYSHGVLVLPIALWILWKLWPDPAVARPKPWPLGWALVVVALVVRWRAYEQGASWTETASLLPLVWGLGLARVGPRFFWKVWPAFGFLLFLFPLPDAVNGTLSQPLQSIATTLSTKALRLLGLWVMPEGNVILVGNERLEVAEACNGLSMLMSLAATVTAFAALMPMANLKRGFLLCSIVPVALISNVIRITATAWCYYTFGAEVGSKWAHDIAGWAMMPLAMVLVFAELALLNWVIEDREVGPASPAPAGHGLGLIGGPGRSGATT